MAAKAGYGGSITFPGKTAGVQSWTLDEVGEVVDVTTLDDSNIRQFLATMKTATGTLTALWDVTDTVDVLDTGTARLRLGDGAQGYVLTIIITGKSSENRFDDVVRANLTFQADGSTYPSLSSSSSST